jgi:hypothetical protein
MFKRLQVSALIIAAALTWQQQAFSQCATGAPPESWEAVFSAKMKEEAQKMLSGKSQIVTKTIPVVVHVVHFGDAYGVYPNIDSFQIKSQIAALNADFGGQGDGIANLPSEFAGAKSNTGIQFCRAAVDYSGTTMLEPGTHRFHAGLQNWQSPNTPTLDLQAYFNSVIIPNTIWPPDKYLNIWVSDRPPAATTLTTFGTYPPNSGQIGIPNSNIGSLTNDGIWVYAKAFGTTGAVVSPTDKGRTATHQLGHWLGLRHIWGDGNCLPDYCDDTPVQKAPTSGCPSGLTAVDICGVNQSPYGNMYMNFMDETDDACKYMFTNDQALRMMAAMSQSPLRSSLGTHGLCDYRPFPAASAATASFNINTSVCVGLPFMPNNTSSGFPQPTFFWSAVPAVQFLPNNTSSHPNILISNPGSYVISLVATNSLATSTHTLKVTTNFTCNPQSLCVDTLESIKKTDTLTILRAPVNGQVSSCTNSLTTGYLTGTSCYHDKELAQYFPPNTFTGIPYPQVNSVIVFFDSTATKGGGTVVAHLYGGTPGGGPAGSMGAGKMEFMSTIMGQPKSLSTNIVGKPNYQVPGRKLIYYKFDFDKPITITAPQAGFFVGIEIPSNGFDSLAIFSDTKTNLQNDSSAWFRNQFGTWKTFRYNRASKVHLAILPQISCSPITGIVEQSFLYNEYVNLMPNPGNGDFRLVLALPQPQEISITVLNLMGQKIMGSEPMSMSTHVTELDLNDQPDGIYFVVVSNGQQKVVKKLVLTH